MGQLIETLRGFGTTRLAIMATVIVALIGGLHFVTTQISEPNMVLLYANLDLAEAGQVVAKIEGMGIEAEIRGGGTEIYVPANRAARLRMDLAEAGLPRGGTIGYEIFDKTDNFGTTGFIQDINHLRALEGELARTIATLSQVESARVHLVLPKREVFSRDHQEPSASIMLRLRSAGKLPQTQVQAIQQLVASAVPNLSSERVSVVDDRGTLLARGDNSSDSVNASNLEEMRLSYENRLSQVIENLLEKNVGTGKVRAEVSLDINHAKTTTNSEEFNPDTVIRSQQTVEEGESNKEQGGGSTTTAGNEQPGAAAPSAGAGGANSNSNRKEETINYEVSKTIKTQIKETGEINRLTVAVMVDGNYLTDAKGAKTYQPRSKEEIDQLTKLVKNAIGFNDKRGDAVEVINMKFVDADVAGTEAVAPAWYSITHPDVMHLVEAIIIGVIALLVLILVVKPILTQLLATLSLVREQQPTPQQVIAPPQVNLAGQTVTTNTVSSLASPPSMPLSNDPGKMVSLQKVEGQVREDALRNVASVVESKPGDAVTIVRDWLHEAS